MNFNLELVAKALDAYAPDAYFESSPEFDLSCILGASPEGDSSEGLFSGFSAVLGEEGAGESQVSAGLSGSAHVSGASTLAVLPAEMFSEAPAAFQHVESYVLFDEAGIDDAHPVRAELEKLQGSRTAADASFSEGSSCSAVGGRSVGLSSSPSRSGSCLRAIVLRSPCSQQDVMARLAFMRQELNAWSEGLLRALLAEAPLQEVFDQAARAFDNPLMLSDAATRYVLTAGRFPEHFDDALWTTAMRDGLCPVELYYRAWFDDNASVFEQAHAFFADGIDGEPRRYACRNLVHDGVFFGMFEMVAANAALTSLDLAFADYIGDLLSGAFAAGFYGEMGLGGTPLQALLFEREANEQAVSYLLKRMRWSEDEAFYMVLMDFSDKAFRTKALRDQIKQRVLHRYPKAFLLDQPESVVAIAVSRDYPFDEVRSSLSAGDVVFLPPLVVRYSMSSETLGFSHLLGAYAQATFALEQAKGICGEEGQHAIPCFFDDCFFKALFADMETDDVLLPPAPLALLARSDEEGTEYVRTLLAYFESGCNAAKAAEMLHIHRNTLSYRLKKIHALSGIDVEHPEGSSVDVLRLLVCCKALEDRRSA